MDIKTLCSFLLLCWSFSGVAQSEALNFAVEIEQSAGSPNQNFSIKADPDTAYVMDTHWRNGGELPEEETGSPGYGGSDWPYDIKPRKPPYGGWWEYATSLIEYVDWLPLYATNRVIGYSLMITPKENTVREFSYSWLSLVAAVIIERLESTQRNPEQPLFNQIQEQEENRLSRLAIITVPVDGSRGTSGSGECSQNVSSQDESLDISTSRRTTDLLIASIFGSSNEGNDGDKPPQKLQHNYAFFCPACNYYLCKQSGLDLQMPQMPVQALRPNTNTDTATVGFHSSSPTQTFASSRPVAVIQPYREASNSASNNEGAASTSSHYQAAGEPPIKKLKTTPLENRHIHSGKGGDACGIDGCTQWFTNPSEMKSHKARKHGQGE